MFGQPVRVFFFFACESAHGPVPASERAELPREEVLSSRIGDTFGGTWRVIDDGNCGSTESPGQ